jgi:hypothetical protein
MEGPEKFAGQTSLERTISMFKSSVYNIGLDVTCHLHSLPLGLTNSNHSIYDYCYCIIRLMTVLLSSEQTYLPTNNLLPGPECSGIQRLILKTVFWASLILHTTAYVAKKLACPNGR